MSVLQQETPKTLPETNIAADGSELPNSHLLDGDKTL